ncbi:MAG TPA: helix-turn-helix domain-containing protein [Candidatus Eisenbacteria bacterium]|nr:helix-turn-helix domain-containing protein [Candidatus Eisenbacteria bacterium]
MARGTFGERLKRERELREVPLDEITLATRIGPRFLEALENEDWDKLPGGVFNRGFVRSIARYLGLDEEAFLAEYDLAHTAHAQIAEQKLATQKIENRIPPTPLWIPIAFALVSLLVLAALIYGGIYGWRKFVKHSVSGTAAHFLPSSGNLQGSSSASSSRVPAASLTAASTTASASEVLLDLSVAASVATHVTVRADGAGVFDAQLRPGETHHFSAKSDFVITAADSSAVLLELNGEAMPPLGEPGASGTMTLSRKDLRQGAGGNSQP